MAAHRIYARHSRVEAADRLSIPLIKRCVRAALAFEGVDLPCEVSILITDDLSICGINREYRGVDEPTDVLSFPMQGLVPGAFDPGSGAADPESGLLPLGEIAISAERVGRQAQEYFHSRERETAYLTIHSALHLLGYDHVDEAEGKKEMRGREKLIMQEMGFDDDK
jgi:probable rRNA maturation factor